MAEADRPGGDDGPGHAPILFKYTGCHTAGIVLENTTLRWSTPGTLNDPYDMQFDLQVNIDREAVQRAALRKQWEGFYGPDPVPAANVLGTLINLCRGVFPRLSREEFEREFGAAINEAIAAMERALPEVREHTRALLAQSKILCLSDVPDIPPMWAHYAEQHQGAVLGFREAPNLDSPWRLALPVRYVEELPKLLDDDFLADLASGRSTFDTATLMDRLIYTKSAEWGYERECRIFSGDGRDSKAAFEDVPFHPLELECVILGLRTPENDRAGLAALVRDRYPDARLLEVRRFDDRFGLEIAVAPEDARAPATYG